MRFVGGQYILSGERCQYCLMQESLQGAIFHVEHVIPKSKGGGLIIDWTAEFGDMHPYVEERDGGYYLAGTRVALDVIVHAFQDGESPEGILRSFPMAGPLVRIYGAITFYLENKEKIEAYLKDQGQLWGGLSKERPKSDDPVTNRLRGAKEHASPR